MTGLSEDERRNLEESIVRHRGALVRLTEDHTCNMQYRGIRENHGKPHEIYICEICGREEYREYTGTQDTIEWRE